MSERGLSVDVALAVESLRTDLAPYWGAYSIVVEVTFPAANTVRDVAHGLGQVPDGYHVVWADGVVHAEPGKLWTKEIAYLRATAVNIHAKIIFYTLRETYHEA